MRGGIFSRRKWLVAAGALLIPTSRAALAQSYPTRTIQIVVPFPAGGPTDMIARLVAEKLQQRLNKPVIVENRPGGASLIGADAVIRAEPDGHTILCGTVSIFALAPTLNKQRSFNPRATLAPIILATETPSVWVVTPKISVSTVSEFLAYARSHPGQVRYASVGKGTIPHLFGELLKTVTGIDMQHVPYRGSAPALNDVAAGHVELIFDQLGAVTPLVRSGHLKALSIAAPKRYAALPDTPTMAEVGYPMMERTVWTSFTVPIGTPLEIIRVLNAEINTALLDPKLRMALEQTGTFVVGGPPEHLIKIWHSDEEFWREVATRSTVQIE